MYSSRILLRSYTDFTDGFLRRVYAIIYSIQNKSGPPRKSSDKWPKVFMCKLLVLHVVWKKKKENNASILIQIKVYKDKTKINDIEIKKQHWTITAQIRKKIVRVQRVLLPFLIWYVIFVEKIFRTIVLEIFCYFEKATEYPIPTLFFTVTFSDSMSW